MTTRSDDRSGERHLDAAALTPASCAGRHLVVRQCCTQSRAHRRAATAIDDAPPSLPAMLVALAPRPTSILASLAYCAASAAYHGDQLAASKSRVDQRIDAATSATLADPDRSPPSSEQRPSPTTSTPRRRGSTRSIAKKRRHARAARRASRERSSTRRACRRRGATRAPLDGVPSASMASTDRTRPPSSSTTGVPLSVGRQRRRRRRSSFGRSAERSRRDAHVDVDAAKSLAERGDVLVVTKAAAVGRVARRRTRSRRSTSVSRWPHAAPGPRSRRCVRAYLARSDAASQRRRSHDRARGDRQHTETSHARPRGASRSRAAARRAATVVAASSTRLERDATRAASTRIERQIDLLARAPPGADHRRRHRPARRRRRPRREAPTSERRSRTRSRRRLARARRLRCKARARSATSTATLGLDTGELFAFIERDAGRRRGRSSSSATAATTACAQTSFAERLAERARRARHGRRPAPRRHRPRASTIRLAFFKPAHGLTPELVARYEANRLTVTRQLPLRRRRRPRRSTCACSSTASRSRRPS